MCAKAVRKGAKKKTSRAPSTTRSRSVKPIPAGFGTLTPYLVLSNGVEAIEFYKRAFGARELSRHNAPDGKILNAQLKIGDSMILLSDEFPGSSVKSPLSIGTSTATIHIYTKNVDKLWSEATAAGARIVMPLDNQFWGERYGQLIDPFGHHWSISQRIKMSKEEMEQKQRAAMEMFAKNEHPGRESKETLPSGVG